ncbi:CVNH domain-containing protein [Scytonema sp. NUACC26]|uniref:mannose-binding lectin n=1 Tax=Scytonema sp. NUACC26 TaxID=3140176 RepID=UPI0034DC5B13
MSYLSNLGKLKLPCLIGVAACGAILAAASINTAKAEAYGGSNYTNSCSNIRIFGDTLSATCRRVDGSYTRTAIKVRGIENVNGNLSYISNPNASSTYQNSCTRIYVSGDTLSATCRRVNGSYNRTAIEIPGISNINGVLSYSY